MPLVIYATVYDWNVGQQIIQTFTKKAIKKQVSVYVDQMYSPAVTIRRNEAILKRAELKKNNIIVSGYLAYPATLMAKCTGESAYKICKKF